MEGLDIIAVTFNSEKWLNGFFNSVVQSNYSLQKISLIFIDNNSTDGTKVRLKEFKEKNEFKFLSIQILESKKNEGFGKSNNVAAAKAITSHLFFLNIDTELYTDSLASIEKEVIESESQFKVWELRQIPYEHPKIYNPITRETPWASGAALVIERKIFNKVGGFDENIFMYGEDVDLSWRILLEGYKIKYLPKVKVRHFSYETINEIKPIQYYHSIVNHFYLRFKYGTLFHMIYSIKMLLGLFKKPTPFKKGRRKLVKIYLLNLFKYSYALLWNIFRLRKIKKIRNRFFGVQFISWDYSLRRQGDFYNQSSLISNPSVSVIMRSFNRSPKIIREALTSLENQIYQNFEVIFVEDGTCNARSIILEEFSTLDITYISLKENRGRSYAGNVGLKESKGKYVCFLDDDDLLFADHLEVLVREIERAPFLDAVYSKAFVTPVTIENKSLGEYKVHDYFVEFGGEFNKLRLIQGNYFPIQSVLFKKKLSYANGGFDETIDFHEDWDLWLRYALKSQFKLVDKVTSIYRVPLKSRERDRQMESTIQYLKTKHQNLIVEMSLKDVDIQLREIILTNQPFFIHHFWYKFLKKVIKK